MFHIRFKLVNIIKMEELQKVDIDQRLTREMRGRFN